MHDDPVPPEVIQSLMRIDIRRLENDAVRLITSKRNNEVVAWFEHGAVTVKEILGSAECSCPRCLVVPPEDVVD